MKYCLRIYPLQRTNLTGFGDPLFFFLLLPEADHFFSFREMSWQLLSETSWSHLCINKNSLTPFEVDSSRLAKCVTRLNSDARVHVWFTHQHITALRSGIPGHFSLRRWILLSTFILSLPVLQVEFHPIIAWRVCFCSALACRLYNWIHIVPLQINKVLRVHSVQMVPWLYRGDSL